MKHQNILIILLILFTHSAYTQAEHCLLIHSGNINTNNQHYHKRSNDYSGGLAYQYWFKEKKEAIEIGLNYTPIKMPTIYNYCVYEPWFCNSPKIKSTIYPLADISLRLMHKYNLAFKGKLTFILSEGYAIGKIVKTINTTISQYDIKIVDNQDLPGLHKIVHFAEIGGEFRYQINPPILLCLGTKYRITNIYDMEYGFISSFINQLSLSITLAGKK